MFNEDNIKQNDVRALDVPQNLIPFSNYEPKAKAKPEVWMWLANALGYASAQVKNVLEKYEDDINTLLIDRFNVDLSPIMTPAQIAALTDKEPEDFVFQVKECESSNVNFIAYDDENYPMLLREIDSPPLVLYYRGDITVLNKYLTFAIVGTRRPSAYGIEATRNIADELAKKGVVLVSGLAAGLDSESHKASLQNNAITVACIAFGHNKCYPASNGKLKQLIEKFGLVIGEYPPNSLMQKHYFLHRNRLIAGLSYGLCVAEARERSGTMNTVTCALAYSRDVFSVPGSIFSPLCEGTNNLLKEGAKPVTSHVDIMRYYGFDEDEKTNNKHKNKQPTIKLEGELKTVYEALSVKPQTLNQICAKCNLPMQLTIAYLTQLEIEDLVVQQAGRQFVIKAY